MRLINVDTLELEEFFDDDIPKYAILSHTWGHEEVSFQDLCWLHEYEHNRTVYASIVALVSQIGQNMANKAAAIRQRAGFDKIVQSARLAKSKHMLRYVWVDTCCIDKSSSAELSEAINSMFRWYQRSDICIAFLSDVCEDLDDCCLEDSRWFTRGWTLQELLAPSKVVFYDLQWNELCTRDSWAPRIEDITGIPWSALVSQRGLNIWSLAERMSWASKRTTSRKEDMAYCLMGLFEINMPLLYGEGGKAFIRLQQEIIKEHRDQSLFAWGHNESMLTVRSIFAPSPSLMGSVKMAENTFTHMDTCHLSNKHLENTFASMDAFHLSNKYLEISLNILQVPNTGLSDIYYALWDVWSTHPSNQKTHYLCFPLFPLFPASHHENDPRESLHMARCPSGPLMIARENLRQEMLYQKILIAKESSWYWDLGLPCNWLTICIPKLHRFLPSARLVEIFPPAFFMERGSNFESLDVKCWFSNVGQPEVHVFRFLVFDDVGEETMKGDEPMQLIVVIDMRDSTSTGSGAFIAKKATAVVWTHGTRSRVGEGKTWCKSQFCSLADAAFAGFPLLDAQMWFEDFHPFLIHRKPLKVETYTDWQSESRGQSNDQSFSISFSLD